MRLAHIGQAAKRFCKTLPDPSEDPPPRRRQIATRRAVTRCSEPAREADRHRRTYGAVDGNADSNRRGRGDARTQSRNSLSEAHGRGRTRCPQLTDEGSRHGPWPTVAGQPPARTRELKTGCRQVGRAQQGQVAPQRARACPISKMHSRTRPASRKLASRPVRGCPGRAVTPSDPPGVHHVRRRPFSLGTTRLRWLSNR